MSAVGKVAVLLGLTLLAAVFGALYLSLSLDVGLPDEVVLSIAVVGFVLTVFLLGLSVSARTRNPY